MIEKIARKCASWGKSNTPHLNLLKKYTSSEVQRLDKWTCMEREREP
jgi:hypothetical protein